ncbi:Putative amidase domain-containing protein [Laceyella tengchongensis]|uniref:Amidase domain-containing protein n=1 Tax=Laceyella tengchongensis TaxID=574699 RepID=A0AA45WIV8_9BACL|nr:amidase domain-containing protein [Laceyella tengchongensis]SMP01376.1 Putative amidase domain-containing protein [Laceyella tengchongensis]
MAYDRARAVKYAETFWSRPNPYYKAFADDCTNFVSQCLRAGGLPMARGWWYRRGRNGQASWSHSWAVAHSLCLFLKRGGPTGRTREVGDVGQLQLGDVICYDWEGDGRWNHNTIITAFAEDGSPLVNARTISRQHFPWDYKASYAWTPQTRYAFLHIE